ncbi:MAG: hypothetical protein KDC10_07510 [Calditrichaeota bacterium]|nr:hypothetical protein [Calditrichota bacterium]
MQAWTRTLVLSAILLSASRALADPVQLPLDGSAGFGKVVALDGDWAVAGAPDTGIDGLDRCGAAGLLHFNGEDWQLQTLLPDTLLSYDLFGGAVALYGDRLAIGAERAGGGGSIYTFRLVDGAWLPDQVLQPSVFDDLVWGRYGRKLEMSDRYLVAGPVFRNGDRYYEIHAWNGSAWVNPQAVTGDPGNSSSFESDLALDGDWLAIGGASYGSNEFRPGAVAVFTCDEGEWMRDALIVSDVHGGAFGTDLQLQGDQLVVGRPGNGRGDVQVYRRAFGQWTLQQSLASDIVVAWDFGQELAVESGRLFVAAVGNTGGSYNSDGYVFAYRLAGADWVEDGLFAHHDELDGLGAGLALSGSRLLVGAPAASGPDGQIHAGQVEIFAIETVSALQLVEPFDEVAVTLPLGRSEFLLDQGRLSSHYSSPWPLNVASSSIQVGPDFVGVFEHEVTVTSGQESRVDTLMIVLDRAPALDFELCGTDCGPLDSPQQVADIGLLLSAPLPPSSFTIEWQVNGEVVGLQGGDVDPFVCLAPTVDPASLQQGDLVQAHVGNGGWAVLPSCVWEVGATAVAEPSDVPAGLELLPAAPNPFNPRTMLSFWLPAAQVARLEVFDLLGRKRKVLVDDLLPAGVHRIEFDGAELPSGPCFIRLRSGSEERVLKVLLVK